MDLVTVAAVADNDVIGERGELPWASVPADKRQYRERVSDHPVILGRRTFESMLDDLPGRYQIVLSRDRSRAYEVDSAVVVHSPEEAITQAEARDSDVAYVLGGGAVFELFMPLVDKLIISRIPGSYPGDTMFPDIDPEIWSLTDEREFPGFTLQQWVRRSNS